jgi:putative flippase GtrA
MALFVVVTLFGLWVLQTIVINLTMPLAKQIVGDQNIALLIAKLIATAVSLVCNYVLYSKLVFKKN